MGRLEELRTHKHYTIYHLWHEETPGVRYVGLTTQDLIDRLCRHIYDCCSNNYRPVENRRGHANGSYNNGKRAMWMRSLLEKGLAPHIDTLQEHYGTFAEARALEDHWMNYYLSEPQYTLLNAKLPKQAQTLVKEIVTPVTDTTCYEQNKETSPIVTCSGNTWISDYYRDVADDAHPLHSYYISGRKGLYSIEPTSDQGN